LALNYRYSAVIALGKSILRRDHELDTDFPSVAIEHNTSCHAFSWRNCNRSIGY